jgi:AcrR family transcriptional regulator
MPAPARRAQLLGVALEKFSALGYHDTSMGEIALAAGVTKPVLYQHFPSKEELYRELLVSTGQELLSDITAKASCEADPYQGVLAGFRAYFAFVCSRTTAFGLLFGGGARTSREFRDTVHDLEDEMAATVGGMIIADLDNEYRQLLGYAIVGLAEVVGRRWVASRAASDGDGTADARDAEEEAERMALRLAQFVWAGLRALPAASSSGRDGELSYVLAPRDLS